jgi:transcription termination factor Rho
MTDAAIQAHLRSLEQPAPPVSDRHRRKNKPTGTHLGVVCQIAGDRRYGFIHADAKIDGIDSDGDVYIGHAELKRAAGIHKGDRVSFNVRPAKKPRTIVAVQVQIAESA